MDSICNSLLCITINDTIEYTDNDTSEDTLNIAIYKKADVDDKAILNKKHNLADIYTPATRQYLAATYERFNADEREYSAAYLLSAGDNAESSLDDNDDINIAAVDYTTDEDGEEDLYYEEENTIETQPEEVFCLNDFFIKVFCYAKRRLNRYDAKCHKCRKPFFDNSV